MGRVLKWIFLSFVGLMIFGLIIESSKTPEQKAAEHQQKVEQARAEMAGLPSFSASELANAYSQNTVAADEIFKGKKFRVSGSVASINTDILGNPYITLRGGVNEFMEPQFQFDESSKAQLSVLREGSQVELICVGRGDVAKTPMSGKCVMP